MTDSKRHEYIDRGTVIKEPHTAVHQTLLTAVYRDFAVFLTGKPYTVSIDPLEVHLFHNNGKFGTVIVQPDLLVLCGKRKRTNGKVNGSPDLIVEIVPSPNYGTIYRKYCIYLEAKVREFWVIDPPQKNACTFVYKDGYYTQTLYKHNDRIRSAIFDGLEVSLETLWDTQG